MICYFSIYFRENYAIYNLGQWSWTSTPMLSQSVTFFTLCGFFSLRHLRMSISVVLTQPGCGRQQETWRFGSLFHEHVLFMKTLVLHLILISLLFIFDVLSALLPLCAQCLWHLCCFSFSITHHWSMNVPERPLLAVKDLPLCLVLLSVDPACKWDRPHVSDHTGLKHEVKFRQSSLTKTFSLFLSPHWRLQSTEQKPQEFRSWSICWCYLWRDLSLT